MVVLPFVRSLAGLSLLATSCAIATPRGSGAAPSCPSSWPQQHAESAPATRQDAELATDEERPWTPVQLGIVNPIQLCDDEDDVRGVRLSILGGRAHSVAGLDINGVIGTTSGVNGGLQVSGFANVSDDHFYGVQVAGLANWLDPLATISSRPPAPSYGLQLAIGLNMAELNGIQVALANFGCRNGLQIGVVNGARDFAGIQLGIARNEATHVDGFQVGLLNYTDTGHRGLQIGAINMTRSGFQLGLINCNREGFLPIFPIFNF